MAEMDVETRKSECLGLCILCILYYIKKGMSSSPQIIEINVKNDKISVDNPNVKKMVFIMNALEQGWRVKKKGEAYIFSKKHEGRREILRKDYLDHFIEQNFDSSCIFGK